MRIQYITNVRLPTQRAHGLQIMTVCEAFAKEGVEISLIVPKRFNKLKENPFSYYKVSNIFKIQKVFCIDTQPLIKDFMPFLLKATFSWIQWISFAFFSLFFAKKKELLYSRDEMVLFFHSFFRKKIVYEVHSLPKSGFFFYRFIFRRCFKIVTITDYMGKQITQQYGIKKEKILTAHDAINLEDFKSTSSKLEAKKRLKLPQNKIIIMYIGALEGWKGHDTLLEASKGLDKKFQVVIIGGTAEKVKKLKKAYPQVIFLGFRPFHELPENQAAADILLIPNSGKEKISRYYTSPLKLFTSMASKRAIIASKLPSLEEVVSSKEVLFFEADNVTDLKDTIISLSEDKELQKTLYTNAYKKVKEHTWKKRTQSILRHLKK